MTWLDEGNPRLGSRLSMFRRVDPAIADAVEARECWTCGAKPGALCVTQGGRVTWFHVARLSDPEKIDPRREAAALASEAILAACGPDAPWRGVYGLDGDRIAAELAVIAARTGWGSPSLYRRRQAR